jgi:hypothetical protein
VRNRLLWLALAAVSYVPLLATKPGLVAADTKQYLYLDPGRLTVGAASMWDPNVGLGTVTHQNIGYLFPMGPYYTALHWLGVPTWVAQRLWMGSLLMAAGAGVIYCARRLGLAGPGVAVAAFAYTLSPYMIDYLGRISAILMPWAALGWMVGFTIMAARKGGWRYPAAFALVVALVGGINATSIVLACLPPALWLLYAVWGSREVTGRRAAAAGARLAGLSVLVSLWWVAGLWAEARYGLNILRVTETVPTVSRTSSAAEVLRGLGYWYFYGWDKVQPWTLQAVPYTQSVWLLIVSFAVPVVAAVLGLLVRWRYRAYALGLVIIGAVVAVGAFPYSRPSWFGGVLESLSSGTVGLAMRSLDRVVPAVVLGMALLMGAGVEGLALRRWRVGLMVALGCVALVAADLPPLWTGDVVASNLDRPSAIPAYWDQAATYLNAAGDSSRVLGLPGEDFAAYSWGVTQDPVAPGLLDRPYVARQVVPAGTPAAANLVQAIDEPLQEGTLPASALAPLARLMSVGQVLLQSDLQYERYHLPLPQALWQELVPPPAGLEGPVTFGAPNPASPIRYPLNSELRLGLPALDPQPPALAVFNVPGARPLVRTESAAAPLLVAGDGPGLVEAASAGLLRGDPAIVYSASLAHDPAGLSQAMADGAVLVVTDTNALAGQRWGSLRDNIGQVDQPGVSPMTNDPGVYSLPVFPGAGDNTRTVAILSGISSVRANAYGDSLSFTPENRPVNAVDGNRATAWTFGAHSPVRGQTIQINLTHAVTTDHINLLQAQLVRPHRHITRVTLRFDGSQPVTVALTAASFSSPGQTVRFPARTFHQLELTADAAGGGSRKRFDGLSQVGFAEISIPGVGPVHEALRLPVDLLGAAGAGSLSHPLYILMNRQRAIEPPRHDPEPSMARVFDLPTARTFAVGGTVEINAGDSDALIDQMIGLASPSAAVGAAAGRGPAPVRAANSSTRLDEDRHARADAAVDHNPLTAWIAETGPQAGEWLSYDVDRPVTVDHLDLQVLNDGRHSLPSRITVSTEQGSRTVAVPQVPVGYGRPQGSTSSVPVSFAPLSGSRIRITIDAVHQVRALDYYATFSGATDILPVGIAELGLPVVEPAAPKAVPGTCRTGLLTVDGRPVDIEINGTTADALAGKGLSIRGCGPDAAGIRLGPGSHLVQTAERLPSGWSIDLLTLASAAGGAAAGGAGSMARLASSTGGVAAAGGGPGSPGSAGSVGAAADAPAAALSPPPLHLVSHNRTSWTVRVNGNGHPFWLVLGQSLSSGWSASLAGGHRLGAPQLVDGYANGWYVPAGLVKGPTTISINWRPQEVVWAAIGVSAVAVAASAAIAFWPGAGGGAAGIAGAGTAAAGAAAGAGSRRRRRGPADRSSQPCTVSRASVFGLGGRRPRPVRVVAAAVLWGLLAAAVSRPAIGVIAAAAVGAGCWWKRGRLAVRAGAIGALLLLGLYVVVQQWRHQYLPTIEWPSNLSSANDVAWTAILLLGSDAVAGLLRGRWAGAVRSATPPDAAPVDIPGGRGGQVEEVERASR